MERAAERLGEIHGLPHQCHAARHVARTVRRRAPAQEPRRDVAAGEADVTELRIESPAVDGTLVLYPRPQRPTHPRSHGKPGGIPVVLLLRPEERHGGDRRVQHDQHHRAGERGSTPHAGSGARPAAVNPLVKSVRSYDAQYGQFSTELYAEIRREAFGEDIGQNSWLTSDEHDLFIEWMRLSPHSHVLDIACGSGRTTLRIASRTGCTVHGLDIHQSAIAEARAAAEQGGLASRSTFELHDAANPLPFEDKSFDALICIDAINHLPDRQGVLAEWARVLKPEGILVFTDPVVVTGPLSGEEIAIRSSIGFFLFVPPGVDERFLEAAGFHVAEIADRTPNMALSAQRRMLARQRREVDLRRIEAAKPSRGQHDSLKSE